MQKLPNTYAIERITMKDFETYEFTISEFDSGLAHNYIRSLTDDPDKFPGTWCDIWRFEVLTQRWEVTVGVPQ